MWAPLETSMVMSISNPLGLGRLTTVEVVSVKSVNFTSSSIWLSVVSGESRST